MGLFRGVGYFFSILIIISGLFLIYTSPLFGIPVIIVGIIFIWILKKSGQVASMQKDMRYLADRERKYDEQLDDAKRKLIEDQKRLDDLERKRQKTENNKK